MSQLKKCLYIIDLLRRRGSMTLNEINQSFRNSPLYDKNIEPRTFARYKDFIALNFPYYIEFNNRTKKYELFRDEPLYGEDNSLYDYLLSPTGVENVHVILEAIDKERGLECSYYSFTKESVKEQTIIPCFLKTWEGRWYLVAEPANQQHEPAVYALERMNNIRLTDKMMHPSKKIVPEKYFDGSFGINHSDSQKPEKIRIKVYGSQVSYVRTLPIHESQKEVETTEDWSIFEYRLVPCFNLYQELLWHREKIEVLEPLYVREEMKNIVEALHNIYK